jgi:hemoglobin
MELLNFCKAVNFCIVWFPWQDQPDILRNVKIEKESSVHTRPKSSSPSASAVTDSSPSPPITENNLHAVLGTDGIQRLTAAFYRRIPADDLLGPMYPPDDLAGAEERLRMFLTFRFGGPQDYLQKRGHPALRARHAPFTITQAARDRWMLLMTQAIEECQFSAAASQVLKDFLGHVATFLINR